MANPSLVENGVLSDKAPPFVMISMGLGICAVSNIVIGFFPPFAAIFVLWMSNAYAQSMLWGSMASIMSVIYDERTAKKRTALLSTSVTPEGMQRRTLALLNGELP